jgi:putative tributyrin esterase
MLRVPVAAAGMLVLAGGGVPRPLGTSQATFAPSGTVQVAAFVPASLGVRKRFLVYLPPSYSIAPARRFPVLYLLHGLHGNEGDWVAQGDLDVIADSLIAGGMPETIIVMPDGDDGFFTNWSRSPGYAACAADSTREESAATFCVRRSDYGDYIARDLVGWVDGHYRTLADRAHRGVAGLSMGGTGALTLALSYPAVFRAVLALSPPVMPLYVGPHPYRPPARLATTLADWEQARGYPLNAAWRARWGADTSGWWRQDPARTVQRLLRAGAAMPAVRIDEGMGDPYLDENRAFDALLTQLGVAHQYHEYPGGHDWSFWDLHAPDALAWIVATIASAGAR